MNRALRESVLAATRNTPPLNHHVDDNLDLFSKTRRHDIAAKVGEGKKTTAVGLDDLLSSAGKHDYDWLLTPPGTPSSDALIMAPRGPLLRSISTTKASRLSETSHAAKPTRTTSVTRSNSHSNNKSTSILNTSSSSVSSYIRPSTPTNNRSSSITRPSSPSPPSLSRSTTPSRPRPAAHYTSSSMDKPTSRPSSQNSRLSTPTSRPQISNATSRPSTPTRRPSLSPISGPSTPASGRGRNVASLSRPSSPGPRVQAPPKPIALPDFPLDTPPNLRTSLPDRPISAGRSRPGMTLTGKGNVDPTTNTATAPRRQPSPVVTRGRLAEPTGRGRPLANGHHNDVTTDSQKELTTRKPVKASTDSTGFGRTISKKSLDMAIRHMDIRNGSNGFRPLTGSNLFPQSIRSANQKSQPVAASANRSSSVSSNGAISENRNHISRFSDSGSEEDKSQSSARLTNIDIYESSRYDMILLKEDMKNTNWLHSIDDKSDQGSIFDNGFELLPEPFDPL